jgi:hypothetical protein
MTVKPIVTKSLMFGGRVRNYRLGVGQQWLYEPGTRERDSGSVLPARKGVGLSWQLPVLGLRAMHGQCVWYRCLLRFQSSIWICAPAAILRASLLTSARSKKSRLNEPSPVSELIQRYKLN